MKKVTFSAVIRKEKINPYVDVPVHLGKRWDRKGTVPVQALIGGKIFKANLMPLGRQRGFEPGQVHRLYLNLPMRQAAGKDVDDRIRVIVTLDTRPRVTPMVPALARELRKDPSARKVFEKLSPSHQKELLRYLGFLKGEEALKRNVEKVMRHLKDPKTTWFGKKIR